MGAGPGGLAVAIEAVRRGLRVVVLEAHALPVDKCCGEGIMPRGVSALAAMGVTVPIAARLTRLRYVEPSGRSIEAELPEGGALGVRRLVLSTALTTRARAAGVELRACTQVTGLRTEGRLVHLRIEAKGGAHVDTLAARVVVGADGLGSPTRRLAGMTTTIDGRRYGLRRHLAVVPWFGGVEVHFGEGAEAYVTAVSDDEVNVAFLWERRRGAPATFEKLLERFPRLRERCTGVATRSSTRGCGPLLHHVPSAVRGRVALVGDAAGYVDAITGEGVSLALLSALSLGACLAEATVRGQEGLEGYRREQSRLFAHYAQTAQAVLTLSRRPRVRGLVLSALGALPGVFDRAVEWAVGG